MKDFPLKCFLAGFCGTIGVIIAIGVVALIQQMPGWLFVILLAAWLLVSVFSGRITCFLNRLTKRVLDDAIKCSKNA